MSLSLSFSFSFSLSLSLSELFLCPLYTHTQKTDQTQKQTKGEITNNGYDHYKCNA